MLLWSPGLTIQPSLRRLNRAWRGLYALYTTACTPHFPITTTTVPLQSFSQEDFIITIPAVVVYGHVYCVMGLKEAKSTPLTSPSPHLPLYLIPFYLNSGALLGPLLPNHAYSSHPTPPLLPRLLLDLRLQYLEALESIWAVCDWVASRDSFL